MTAVLVDPVDEEPRRFYVWIKVLGEKNIHDCIRICGVMDSGNVVIYNIVALHDP